MTNDPPPDPVPVFDCPLPNSVAGFMTRPCFFPTEHYYIIGDDGALYVVEAAGFSVATLAANDKFHGFALDKDAIWVQDGAILAKYDLTAFHGGGEISPLQAIDVTDANLQSAYSATTGSETWKEASVRLFRTQHSEAFAPPLVMANEKTEDSCSVYGMSAQGSVFGFNRSLTVRKVLALPPPDALKWRLEVIEETTYLCLPCDGKVSTLLADALIQKSVAVPKPIANAAAWIEIRNQADLPWRCVYVSGLSTLVTLLDPYVLSANITQGFGGTEMTLFDCGAVGWPTFGEAGTVLQPAPASLPSSDLSIPFSFVSFPWLALEAGKVVFYVVTTADPQSGNQPAPTDSPMRFQKWAFSLPLANDADPTRTGFGVREQWDAAYKVTQVQPTQMADAADSAGGDNLVRFPDLWTRTGTAVACISYGLSGEVAL